jgi:hypothetical protein
MGLTLACAVQMGTGWALLYILLGGFAVFFCAQWEEYVLLAVIQLLGHKFNLLHLLGITLVFWTWDT